MGLKKKTLIVAVVSCLLASIAVLGTTYAIYVVNLKGDKTQQVSSGTLNVEFQNNSSAISLTNAYPMTDEDGLKNEGIQFSVANTGTLPAKYRITLVEDSNNTLTNNYIKYVFYKEGEPVGTPALLSSLSSLVLVPAEDIANGSKTNYTLKLWIDENAGNETQGKTFQAKIRVESVQATENFS